MNHHRESEISVWALQMLYHSSKHLVPSWIRALWKVILHCCKKTQNFQVWVSGTKNHFQPLSGSLLWAMWSSSTSEQHSGMCPAWGTANILVSGDCTGLWVPNLPGLKGLSKPSCTPARWMWSQWTGFMGLQEPIPLQWKMSHSWPSPSHSSSASSW